MLPRSFVKVRRRPGQLLNDSQTREMATARLTQLACRLLLSSSGQQARSVATTSSSKIQQAAAHQRKTTGRESMSHQLHQQEQQQQLNQNRHSMSHEQDHQLQSMEKYQARLEHLNLWHSVETIKRLGHRLAQLDPLQLSKSESLRDISWSHKLIDEMRNNSNIVPTSGFLDTKQPLMAVNELIDAVWTIYANNNCGLEFSHISNQSEVEWLTSQWEKLNEIHHLDQLDQYNLAKLMLECEAFDHFLAAKFPTTKRYGCEGMEPMLVVMDEILRLCHLGDADSDELTRSIGRIDDVIIGMPHRGRLNLLACLLGFEPMAIFQKIMGEPELDQRRAWMAKSDVLSHLSTSLRFVYGVGRQDIGLSRDTPAPINVTLLPNPSHLELVAPVTAGSARGRAHNILHGYSSSPKFVTFNAKFQPAKDDNLNYRNYLPTILPIQIHGDASVAGQGVIQETLQMANLPEFTVGGSLHIVANNQIGFTTGGGMGRSSRHCTDIFKLIEAPIIHVNGENISSVVRATRLALSYRQKFGKDVVIDLIGYRQHGHNEMDEPAFTQPVMYSEIRQRKSIPQKYCDEINMDQLERQQIVDEYKIKLQDSFKKMDRYKPDNDNYRNFKLPTEYHRDHICSWQTGYPLDSLASIAVDSVKVPENFNVHPNLERILINERKQKYDATGDQLNKIPVDWATAEILAFGSLLKQNHSIRLAGQDVARGTFSTRHAVLFDQTTGEPYCPLNEMAKNDNKPSGNRKAQLEVANTILSEEAALAYEFGYSAETCELTIWEAQFGDFFNTAQSVIDTLVSSSESKWLKQSPLTILLPHGLDGMGPEHSSARLERFLQLSSSSMDSSIDTEAKVNWSICNPTKPSQYFHLLRRQVLRPFRRPLVLMAPKMMLRHAQCVSDLAVFGPDKSFEPILDDPAMSTSGHNDDDCLERRQQVNTIVLCSGKMYFNLNEQRNKLQMDNVALIRIEELCPFPIQSIIQTLKSYPNVRSTNYVWAQEEHKNQGAYSFVESRLDKMANIKLRYLGRPESELPAIGSSSLHKRELEQLIKQFQGLKQ